MATLHIEFARGGVKDIEFEPTIAGSQDTQELFQGSFIVVTDLDGVTHAFGEGSVQEATITG